jgi:hypothetical protein
VHKSTAPPIPTLTYFSASGGYSYNSTTNLTSNGTLEWFHWGYPYAADLNAKNGAAHWISLPSWYGVLSDDKSQSIDFTWYDGTPYSNEAGLTSGTNTTGGITFSVQSTSTVHTLSVYVGAYRAKGTFWVTFQGTTVYSSAFDMTNDPANSGDNTRYIIQYSTNVPNSITINYAMSQADGSSSYVIAEAVALS